MEKKYKIIWLLNSTFDKKVDISTSLEMLRELNNNGNEVMLVTSYRKNKPKYDIKTIYLKIVNIALLSRLHFNLKCFQMLYKRDHNITKNTIIIVDQNSIYGALLLKLISKLFRKDRVNIHFDIRTIPVEQVGIKGIIRRTIFWYPAIKLGNNYADSFSYITREIEKMVMHKYKKSCIWSSGVNINKFTNKDKIYITKKEKVLFYHGVLTPKRGIRETIEAIEIVKDNIDNIKFVIVGDGADFQYLKRMVIEKELDNHVKLLGRIDYKYIEKYIEMSDVCICPLPNIIEWEVSSPLKVLEYTAMGKPCILTEITPHKKLFDKNTDGIYWAGNGSKKEIAKSILNAFYDKKKKYCYNNLIEIAHENSWQKKVNTLTSYWNEIYY